MEQSESSLIGPIIEEASVPQIVPQQKRITKIKRSRSVGETQLHQQMQQLYGQNLVLLQQIQQINGKVDMFIEQQRKMQESMLLALDKCFENCQKKQSGSQIQQLQHSTQSLNASFNSFGPQYPYTTSAEPNTSFVPLNLPSFNSPLTLPEMQNSTLSAVLQFIFASASYAAAALRYNNPLSAFYQQLVQNPKSACFNIQQSFGANIMQYSAFDFLISMLNSGRNAIQRQQFTGQIDYLQAFQDYFFENQRKMSSLQRECEVFQFQQYVCANCGVFGWIELQQYLEVDVPQFGQNTLEGLISQQYNAKTQCQCKKCGKAASKETLLGKLPNQLFILFRNLIHTKVTCSKFIAVPESKQLTNGQECYKLNALMLYDGNQQFSCQVVGAGNVEYFCNGSSCLQRKIDEANAQIVCCSYQRYE